MSRFRTWQTWRNSKRSFQDPGTVPVALGCAKVRGGSATLRFARSIMGAAVSWRNRIFALKLASPLPACEPDRTAATARTPFAMMCHLPCRSEATGTDGYFASPVIPQPRWLAMAIGLDAASL